LRSFNGIFQWLQNSRLKQTAPVESEDDELTGKRELNNCMTMLLPESGLIAELKGIIGSN
jgi:hypothetical protein